MTKPQSVRRCPLQRSLPALLAILVLVAVLSPGGASAGERRGVDVELEESILAVITHKGGFASGLAHDHLIVAGDYELELRLPEGESSDLVGAHFTLKAPVASLRVDEDPLRGETFPRLQELGILEDPFEKISEKDRGKIRKAMLGKGQLHGEAHPELTVELLSVTAVEEPTREGFPYRARFSMTVRGKSVEGDGDARIEAEGESVTIEMVAELQFSDFDIEPYSAGFGAVKNQDGFHLYAHIVGSLATDK